MRTIEDIVQEAGAVDASEGKKKAIEGVLATHREEGMIKLDNLH